MSIVRSLVCPAFGMVALVFALAAAVPAAAVSAEAAPASAAAELQALHEAGDAPAFLERIDRALYEDLVRDLPEDRRPARPPVDAERLVASLDGPSALCAFHLAGDRVYAVWVSRGQLSTAVLDSPLVGPMAARLAAWAADPAGHPYDPRAAFALWGGLFHPFRHDLGGVRRLVIAASSDLAGLPFEVLLMAPHTDLDSPLAGFLGGRFEVVLEPTLGARLAWAGARGGGRLRRLPAGPDGTPDPGGIPIAPGDLVLAGGGLGRDAARLALRLCRSGARAALIGPTPGPEPADFMIAYSKASSNGRRRDATATTALKGKARRDDPRAAPETWAFPLLYGAR